VGLIAKIYALHFFLPTIAAVLSWANSKNIQTTITGQLGELKRSGEGGGDAVA
jgi:hypothetical protein